ncbi:hypothetical protein EV361DRAFT_467401 [Lentinula raphanica]|nr:hypothetical protein EV361DRAFT_467401 [Lentinula raphanica]
MRWTISAVLLRPLYSLVVLLCNHQSHQRTLDVMYIRSSALMLWPASRQDLDHPSRIVGLHRLVARLPEIRYSFGASGSRIPESILGRQRSSLLTCLCKFLVIYLHSQSKFETKFPFWIWYSL